MDQDSVLVVGASRGIGAELARQYLAAGWRVHATVRDLATPGDLGVIADSLTLYQLDVRDSDQIAAMADDLHNAALDVVVHSAGIYQGHTPDELMRVNAVAPIRVVEALLATEALRREGVVAILTSQMGARRGSDKNLGGYGESKAALNDDFRRRAGSWRDHGVIAVVVHPGWVRTDMGGASAPLSVEESVEGVRRLIAAATPGHHGRFWTWDGREHPW